MKLFYKNGDCAAVALQKFRSEKSVIKCCCSISANGLEKMIKKLENTELFEVKSGRGWKPVASTSVEDVSTALQEETTDGVQT